MERFDDLRRQKGVDVEKRYVISADGELVASGISELFMQTIMLAIFEEDPGVVIKVSLDTRFSKGEGE